ncbi:MAG: glucose 1-dehydrogenase [Pseudomonadota bacterium]
MGRVEGKSVLVTGAAQGLGRCFAEMLAAEGARVALTDQNIDGAREAAAAINSEHDGAAIAIAHDVTSKDDWARALDETVSAFGGLNVLVNNAGVAALGNIETETMENWRRIMDIDVDALFVGTQLAMPYLKKSAPASIINISSVAGMIADGNLLAYNVAKAAVWMMTKSVALHCARANYNVRCNSVHPVFIKTPMIEPMAPDGDDSFLSRQIPMGRVGDPEDVGHMVVYLASDESKFVTGAEFKVDGAITAQ